MEMEKQSQRFHNPFSVNSFSGVSSPPKSSPLHIFAPIKTTISQSTVTTSTPSPLTSVAAGYPINSNSPDVNWSQIITQFPSIFPPNPKLALLAMQKNSAEVMPTAQTTTVSLPLSSTIASLASSPAQLNDFENELDNSAAIKAQLTQQLSLHPKGQSSLNDGEAEPSAALFANSALLQFQKCLQVFNLKQQRQQLQQAQQVQVPFTAPFPPQYNKLQQQMVQHFLRNSNTAAAATASSSFSSSSTASGEKKFEERSEQRADENSRSSSSQSCTSSSSGLPRQDKRLLIDENGEATCPACSQKMGTQPAQWQEHARLERARLVQFLQQLKVDGNKLISTNTMSSSVADALQKREHELQRIRNNHTKRAQMRHLLTTTVSTDNQPGPNADSFQPSMETSEMSMKCSITPKVESSSMCSVCHRECDFLVVGSSSSSSSSRFSETSGRCFTCFQRSGHGIDFLTAETSSNSFSTENLNVNGITTGVKAGMLLSLTTNSQNNVSTTMTSTNSAHETENAVITDALAAKRARLDISSGVANL